MTEEIIDLLIADAVVAIVIIAMSVKYLIEWNNDRKGRR